jgi:hypothetical protein
MAAKTAKPRPNTTAAAGNPKSRLSRQNAASEQAMNARYGTKGQSKTAAKSGPGKRAR